MQGKIALEEHFILPYIDPRHWPPLRRQQRAKSRPRQRSRLRNWLENKTLHAGSALSGEFRIAIDVDLLGFAHEYLRLLFLKWQVRRDDGD